MSKQALIIAAVLMIVSSSISASESTGDVSLYDPAFRHDEKLELQLDEVLRTGSSGTLLATTVSAPHRVRVAYVIPSNRTPQADAKATLQRFVQTTQAWFSDQMGRLGYGSKTFTFETEADGVTPKIHFVYAEKPDTYFHETSFGGVVNAINEAGLETGVAAVKWWVVAEVQTMRPDGSFVGALFGGTYGGGYGMVSGETLARMRPRSLTDNRSYHGMVVPELGPYPLVQNVSFPWFEGDTVSSISSSAQGGAIHELGHALAILIHDFRNETSLQGNIMGNGLRRIRGSLFPASYLREDTRLGSNSALMLEFSPFFDPAMNLTDYEYPGVSIESSGFVVPENGQCAFDFTAWDDTGLSSARIIRVGSGHWEVVSEMPLEGEFIQATIATPYYEPGVYAQWEILVADRAGRMSYTQTDVTCRDGYNRAPIPSVSIFPSLAAVGQKVTLDASGSVDPDGPESLMTVEWDLDGDGVFDTLPTTDKIYAAVYDKAGTYQIKTRLTDDSGDQSLSTLFGVRIESQDQIEVSASDYQAPNSPQNTLDDDLNTRWSAYGDGVWIKYDLQSVKSLNGLKIAWYKGDKRKALFDVEVSNDDVNWTQLFRGKSSGTTLEPEPYLFPAGTTNARYVRIEGHGNTSNDWTSVTEVQLIERPVTQASSYQEPNRPENTMDYDFNTRWSAQGNGEWIKFDLFRPERVSGVKIAWFRGDSRVAYFDIEVSKDGHSWTTVYGGGSSGTLGGLERLEHYAFDPVLARYVRIVGHGNSSNDWNSISEVEIMGKLTVQASGYQPPHAPENTLDGDLESRWSAKGQGEWIKYDLNHEETIKGVNIGWYRGDMRKAYFDVEVSIDDQIWRSAYSGSSSGSTLSPEPYRFSPLAVRYVRITGRGNDDNNWNSITELEIINEH